MRVIGNLWKKSNVQSVTSLLFALLSLTGCKTTGASYSIPDKAIADEGNTFELFENEVFKIDTDTATSVDIAIPKNKIHPTVMIFQHGNHSRKEAHRNQIIEVAKNGFVGIAIQFPNSGQWFENAMLLAKVVPLIEKGFRIQKHSIQPGGVILVGHSFGGYAVSVAAGACQCARGVILLDPAMYDKRGPEYLAKIKAPMIVIGADRNVFRSRKRDLFFKTTGGKSLEFSVIGATHDDAQNPSMFAISSYGIDPFTSRKNQTFITDMIVDSAITLTQKYQFESFASELRNLEKNEKIRKVRIKR